LKKTLTDLKDEPYSLYSVEKILDQIDLITTSEEFKSTNAYAKQNIVL
jgi:outer membrane protein insertion porin family